MVGGDTRELEEKMEVSFRSSSDRRRLRLRCYLYGRGGIRATDNGEANGTFLGEQALIHQLMKDYDAQVFFYGHDHVFISGEKLKPDYQGEGIYYVAGGRSTGPVPNWADNNWFRRLYDYDGDREPDFYTERGFLLVTVYGKSHIDLKYIKSDYTNPSENGTVIFEQKIGRYSK